MASGPAKRSHKRSRHAGPKEPKEGSRESLSAFAPGGHVAHGKKGGNMRWWGGMKEMDYPHAKAFADAETHPHARCVDLGGHVRHPHGCEAVGSVVVVVVVVMEEEDRA